MNQDFSTKKIEKLFNIFVNKNNNNKTEENKNNKDSDINNVNNVLEKSNFNLLQNEDNSIVNDKMLLELDKLIIKPKFEYNLSVNAQRI